MLPSWISQCLWTADHHPRVGDTISLDRQLLHWGYCLHASDEKTSGYVHEPIWGGDLGADAASEVIQKYGNGDSSICCILWNPSEWRWHGKDWDHWWRSWKSVFLLSYRHVFTHSKERIIPKICIREALLTFTTWSSGSSLSLPKSGSWIWASSSRSEVVSQWNLGITVWFLRSSRGSSWIYSLGLFAQESSMGMIQIFMWGHFNQVCGMRGDQTISVDILEVESQKTDNKVLRKRRTDTNLAN